MRMLGGSGVWELFVPEVGSGAMYKFQVCGADGIWRDKADPLAQQAQVPPERASKIVFASHYAVGNDDGRLAGEAGRPQAPIEAADERLYEVRTSARGVYRKAGSATATSQTSWSSTSPTWASPMSS